ncbi:MAG: tRNA (5-methylaminomethyl-2-thiouridine)(34)-methyltransferase MnmD [Microcystaceae cyanobacterium]
MNNPLNCSSQFHSPTLTPTLTKDGSFTFFSETFQETFHSQSGAKEEAERKFVEPCRLTERAKSQGSLTLLDVCFGLGYNSAAALTAIWAVNPQCHVTLMALELDPLIPQTAIAQGLWQGWPDSVIEPLALLSHRGEVQSEYLQARLYLGDARQTLPRVQQTGFLASAIFLDPFSPPKCPQLWTVEFLQLVSACLAPAGWLATYSCAATVRTALLLAGLQVGPSPQVGRRSPGTLANWTGEGLEPLSLREQEHLQTKAAIPYRDPTLTGDRPEILARRQQEQAESELEATHQWKKRWFS